MIYEGIDSHSVLGVTKTHPHEATPFSWWPWGPKADPVQSWSTLGQSWSALSWSTLGRSWSTLGQSWSTLVDPCQSWSASVNHGQPKATRGNEIVTLHLSSVSVQKGSVAVISRLSGKQAALWGPRCIARPPTHFGAAWLARFRTRSLKQRTPTYFAPAAAILILP